MSDVIHVVSVAAWCLAGLSFLVALYAGLMAVEVEPSRRWIFRVWCGVMTTNGWCWLAIVFALSRV